MFFNPEHDLHQRNLTDGMDLIIDFVPNLFSIDQDELEIKGQVDVLRKNLAKLIKQVWNRFWKFQKSEYIHSSCDFGDKFWAKVH